MNFETYILSSGLSTITSDYIFTKPNIPRKKLLNALNEYGRGIPEEDVVALIDDTFWGSAKEGLLITNEGIFFSGRTSETRNISFDEIKETSCSDCKLTVNKNFITKLTYAEKMPLGFLFSELNNYAVTLKKDVSCINKVKLTDEMLLILEKLIYKIKNTPVFYDPQKNKTFGPNPELITTVSGLYLPDELSPEQLEFIAFKLKPKSDEKIIATTFLANLSGYSKFFCITNCGIYLSTDNLNEEYISFDNLKALTTISERENSRFWEVEFSNGVKMITSPQNGFTKPYSKTLLDSIIYLLNNGEINIDLLANYKATPKETITQEKKLHTQAEKTLEINGLRLQYISSDDLFNFIKSMNRIDKVTSFLTSPSDPREAPLSKLKEDFQSLIVKSVSKFRKIVIENSGIKEFENDYATLEIIVFSTAFFRLSMLKRGLELELADTIILEGLKLTFGERKDWRKNKFILVINKFEKSYFDDEDMTSTLVGRLFFGNITKSLDTDKAIPKLLSEGNYSEEDIITGLATVANKMEKSLSIYLDEFEGDINYFIDKSMDLLWSIR
jgi:hypothetical protein